MVLMVAGRASNPAWPHHSSKSRESRSPHIGSKHCYILNNISMTLTNEQEREILQHLLGSLRRAEAQDVLAGIDETRRIGIEETIEPRKGPEINEVAKTRRRPLNDREMLGIVIERMQQRLVVIPAIANALRKKLGS